MVSAWRYKRFHVSYVLAWLCVGLLVGLFVGQYAQAFAWWPTVILAVSFGIVSLKSRRWYACVVMVLVGASLGCMRGASFAKELHVLGVHNGKQVTLVGSVSQDPVLKNDSNMWQAELNNIRIGGEEYVGNVYATIASDDILKRGDVVTVSGRALAGFGSFQLSMYRVSLEHVVRPNDVFLQIRDSFASAVRTVTPEPEASLGLGFVVGQKSALPDDLAEQLKVVGLTHIVVASGYNLTILVRFARRLLARRSRYLALMGSSVLVLGFVFVSGFSASMNRAAVVTILALLAWYYGRKFHPIQLILYVAAVSAVIYPLYVWGDLGWLLSFAAFAGILVVAPILTRLLYRKSEPNVVARLVMETMSAELMTLPIIIVSFGYVPVLALLANVFVAPVIPFAMFLTFVAGVVGWIAPVLTVLSAPAAILIAYVIGLTKWLSSPDWAQFTIATSGLFAVVWYLALGFFVWLVWHRLKVDLRAQSVVE